MNDFLQLLNSSDGRKWLAMQYVLAELPDSQMAEFESALADDVTLCEAVVEACQLSAGVALAVEAERMAVQRMAVRPVMISSARISQGRSWTTRFGVLAACTSLLAVIVMITKTPLPERVDGRLLTFDDAAAAVTLVGLLQDQPPLGLDPEADVDMVPDESLSDLVAPEWLLTAVSLDEPDSSDDENPSSDESNLF